MSLILNKLSPRERNLLTVLLILLIGLGSYKFVYLPQTVKLGEVREKLEQKKLAYERAQILIKEKSLWEQSQIEKEQFSLTALLKQVTKLAFQAEVDIKSFRPEENQQKQDSTDPKATKQKSIQITLEGNFNSLLGFFSAWDKSVNSAVLTSVEIVPANDKTKLRANLVVKALLL